MTVVVHPLGATENHGPHLPLETDTLIARGITERLGARAPDTTVRPALEVGYSPEHMAFSGTRTLAYDEAVTALVDRAGRDVEQGHDRVLFLNAHGGNVPIVQIAVQEIRARFAILAVATKWDRFTRAQGIVSAEEEAVGIHGGEIETSVMLALHPELVDMKKAQDFPSLQSTLIERHTHLRAHGPHGFGWMGHDLNPQGVTGLAARATAETGERLIERAVIGLAELIADMNAFDLAHLRRRPTSGQTVQDRIS